MKKFLTVIMLVCLIASALCLCSCKDDDSNAEILKIEVRSGSLKATYQLDEVLDLSSVYIVVYYSNQVQEPVNVTADMLEGYDTSTCTSSSVSDPNAERKRIIRIRYKGFVTSDWYYTVVYQDGMSKTVTTKARLTATGITGGMDYRVAVGFAQNGITPLYGMTFELKFDSAAIEPVDDFFVGTLSGWDFAYTEVAKDEYRCTYYATAGAAPLNADKAQLFTFVFTKPAGAANTVRITNVVVSDREKKIYMPDAEVK